MTTSPLPSRPLAVPADVTGIEDLDRVATAERLREVTGRLRALEAEQLALTAHWADLHAPAADQELDGTKDQVTGERFLPAGPSGMLVSEFAATTVGAVIGVGSWAAGSLIDDALSLRHRHPVLDRLVRSGRVPVWQARRVATAAARAGLSDEDAREVDRQTARDFARLPFPRAIKVLEAALLRAPSSTAAAQQREAAQRSYVRAYRSNDAGMKVLVTQMGAAGIIRLEAMVTLIADRLLARGDTRPVDVRRAAALLLLANPAAACLLLAGHEAEPQPAPAGAATFTPSDTSHLDDSPPEADEPGEPGAFGSWEVREDRAWPFTFPRQVDLARPEGEGEVSGVVAAALAVGDALRDLGGRLGPRLWDRLRPRSVIYLHGWHGGDGQAPVGDVLRGQGIDDPLLADVVREWVAHDRVEVRPVLDTTTHLAADAYEVPPPIREQVRLLHPFEEFPHGRQASATCDLDHLDPYRPGGPPGQSSTANLSPLGRRHHRTKTHSAWAVHPVVDAPGDRIGALWRAPTGHWFRVDHLGTFDLGRPRTGVEARFADVVHQHLVRVIA